MHTFLISRDSNRIRLLGLAADHHDYVIMATMASQITSLMIVYWTVYSDADQPFIQTQIKENIKAPRDWPLCGELTGDRWIPRTNGQ